LLGVYNITAAAHRNGFQVRHNDVQRMQRLNHDLFQSKNDKLAISTDSHFCKLFNKYLI